MLVNYQKLKFLTGCCHNRTTESGHVQVDRVQFVFLVDLCFKDIVVFCFTCRLMKKGLK